MFGFGKKNNDEHPLTAEIEQKQARWFTFLQKLESRMEEVCEAAVPELKEVFEQDADPYKRAHGRMLAGLIGQMDQMRRKAADVKEQEIIYFAGSFEASYAGSDHFKLLYNFREACYNRHIVFEDKIQQYISRLRDAAGEQDLEAAYRQQVAEFGKIRDKFSCTQCGGNITIPKMFFIVTYVTCPFCQTQNTFHPSTETQLVLHNARSLAEQRTAHLLKAYESGSPRDPALYQQYLRAMFDEWNSIVPDMAGENEKFYERLLKDHHNYHHH
jgi:hypothetical protein